MSETRRHGVSAAFAFFCQASFFVVLYRGGRLNKIPGVQTRKAVSWALQLRRSFDVPQLEWSAALEEHAPALDLRAGVRPEAGDNVKVIRVEGDVRAQVEILPEFLHTVFKSIHLVLAVRPGCFASTPASGDVHDGGGNELT
jgi:hypothetical protein